MTERRSVGGSSASARCVAAAAIVGVTGIAVSSGNAVSIDLWARAWVARHQHPLLAEVLDQVKGLGGWRLALPVLVLVSIAVALAQHSLRPILVTMLALGGLALTVLGLQDVVARPGPTGVGPPATTGAWPSGHATTVAVAALLLLELTRRADASRSHPLLIAAAVLVPSIVGAGLVYGTHHWLTDVLVAAPIAYVLVRLAVWMSGVAIGGRPVLRAVDPLCANPSTQR